MNTPGPPRVAILATRKRPELAGDTTNPEDDPGKYEQIKDLAAMRDYEGWQQDDYTQMTDLL
jgi:hypothetical protein